MNFEKILEYHKNLWTEVNNPKTNFLVKKYYRNICNTKNKRWFYAFNWARRLENLAECFNKENMMVLDTACGLGTESIFAAYFSGANVLGVDSNKNFIEVARGRKIFYEKLLKKSLNVNFENQNILDLNYHNYFDIIWCMEAISHIFPTEKFLKIAHSALKPGGKILISDPNAANPIIQLQLIKEAGFNRGVVKKIDPKTGNEIEEWNEHIRLPSELAKKMKNHGFLVEKINFSIFFPPSLFFSKNITMKTYKLEKGINKIPIIRDIGAIYTVVGKKI